MNLLTVKHEPGVCRIYIGNMRIASCFVSPNGYRGFDFHDYPKFMEWAIAKYGQDEWDSSTLDNTIEWLEEWMFAITSYNRRHVYKGDMYSYMDRFGILYDNTYNNRIASVVVQRYAHARGIDLSIACMELSGGRMCESHYITYICWAREAYHCTNYVFIDGSIISYSTISRIYTTSYVKYERPDPYDYLPSHFKSYIHE